MTIITIENITKSYGMTNLFNNIQFTISSEDKIGLIGVNGTGKSTLLKILSGKEVPDTGKITSKKNVRITYLAQEPEFDPNHTILEHIYASESEEMTLLRDYEALMESISASPEDQALQSRLIALNAKLTALDLWQLETQIKAILTALDIKDLSQKMSQLSGGQRKRVSLAAVLANPADLIILDEPTNHMDSITIDWLENHLRSLSTALIMITHDRYFLDRVVNKTIELDGGNLYQYTGNYAYFLEQKAQRIDYQNAIERKRQNLFRHELEWIRAGVQARGTKSKSRIQRFEALKSTLGNNQNDAISIYSGYTRLGNKIINCQSLSFAYEAEKLISDFEYHFTPNDRIGIIGPNGTGKTTLLKLINGDLNPSQGTIDIGSTVAIGYFSQDPENLEDEDIRAIDYIKETAEFIENADGYKISASELMETFLFNSDLQWSMVRNLSGGERRRLQLLKVLIGAPNVLILDEPTNNLDLDTLKALENYLDDFRGVILCVSHDRYFLDRVCDKLFVFGERKEHVAIHAGNYSDYLERMAEIISEAPKPSRNQSESKPQAEKRRQEKVKISFKEQKLLETLPQEIEKYEARLDAIEGDMVTFASDFTKLTALQEEKESIEMAYLEAMETLETLLEKQKLL